MWTNESFQRFVVGLLFHQVLLTLVDTQLMYIEPLAHFVANEQA
jgi:hypothetical protein